MMWRELVAKRSGMTERATFRRGLEVEAAHETRAGGSAVPSGAHEAGAHAGEETARKKLWAAG